MKTTISTNGFDYLVTDEWQTRPERCIPSGCWYIDDANQVRQSVTDDADYWTVRKNYLEILSTNDPSLTQNTQKK